MPQVATEYGCPTCEAQSGAQSQIIASDSRLVCKNNPSHTWNDSMSFLALKPKMVFTAPKQMPAQQFNQEEVKVLIPPRVKAALVAKWGEKFNATVAGVLEMVADGEVLVIPQPDLEKLKMREFLGTKPGSSAELCGTIFALRQEVQEAKNAEETARKDIAAYENFSPGRVVIDVSSFQGPLTEKARDANMPVKIFLENNLKNAIENSWF